MVGEEVNLNSTVFGKCHRTKCMHVFYIICFVLTSASTVADRAGFGWFAMVCLLLGWFTCSGYLEKGNYVAVLVLESMPFKAHVAQTRDSYLTSEMFALMSKIRYEQGINMADVEWTIQCFKSIRLSFLQCNFRTT